MHVQSGGIADRAAAPGRGGALRGVRGGNARPDPRDHHRQHGTDSSLRRQASSGHPDLPVELVDEDDTSREASLAMVQSGMRKSKRREKGQLDQIAATLILQRFLDRR